MPVQLLVLFLTTTAWGTASAQAGCPVCPVRKTPACEQYTEFSLQLRWLKSAQFAGFYAAQEMGYWEELCLKVILYQPSFAASPELLGVYGAEAGMPHYLYAPVPPDAFNRPTYP
jgi:ABC-type nitrate/sulfonate/bicarbonate transport system substrate-binding protein